MPTVIVCGALFDGRADTLAGPAEILVDRDRIVEVGASVSRPPGTHVVGLSDRTVAPGFIDCHVHLTMDGSKIAAQTLSTSASKALTGLGLAQRYRKLRLHDPAGPGGHGP